jgi:hypothetical protein
MPVNLAETLRAAELLGSSPAAAWIGNKPSEDGSRMIQKCMRCGVEGELELPVAVVNAFRSGARGPTIARLVPAGFDEKLFTWKRAFQLAHEGCTKSGAS